MEALQLGEGSSPPHILVVEDDPLLRSYLADELRDSGFRVVEAANADEALSYMDAHTHRLSRGAESSPAPARRSNAMNANVTHTYSGLIFEVRREAPGDRSHLIDFWRHTSRANIAGRYLGVDDPTQATHRRSNEGESPTATFLAIGGGGEVISVALLVEEAGKGTARVMVFTRDTVTSHGVSWALLARVLVEAHTMGIISVSSVLSVEDISALRLETRMGFVEEAYPGHDGFRLLRWIFPQKAVLAN